MAVYTGLGQAREPTGHHRERPPRFLGSSVNADKQPGSISDSGSAVFLDASLPSTSALGAPL